ncbi:adenylate/guanylate cyclase domain-containing protein [Candidatus Entotheonella palauensis]|uniref:adenylate/guanylate cyclase domain-containing protein n=1 Tax=Candidatus Entotheonella palauensis TaxID=93172 RepID=UPI0015C4330C|nr:adenylate/guanylate cyclase domain-containing protein [Candidatus Entotheonella palauensis]
MGKYKLRTVLIVFFVFQVTITALAVSYLALKHGQDAVNTVVTNLLTEILERVEERLQSFIRDAPRVNAINRATIEMGELDLHDHHKWLTHFWHQKDQFPTVSYFTLAEPGGEWMGLQTHAQLMWHATEQSRGIHSYAISSDGQRQTKLANRVDIYDTLSRDWFRLPLEHRRQIWTPIYVWANPRVLSMTLGDPLLTPDGEVAAVVAVDMALGEIHDYLQTLEIGKTGHAFLLERDGHLIATSAAPLPFIEYDGKPQRIPATDYTNAMVARVSTNLIQQFGSFANIDARQQLRFGQGYGEEHVLVAPFSDPFGLDWLLVVVVPASDFMDDIYAGTRRAVLICLGIFVLTTAFGIVYSGQISKPMKALSERVQRIQALELNNEFDVDSRVAEVDALARALARMQVGLSSFRRFVPANLVQRILELGEEARLGGETRDVTLLFSDIQGYTTLTENLAPETVVALMNIYFEEMEAIIIAHHGIVLDLQGDSILAIFGAPDDLADHTTAATRCAIAMRRHLTLLNMRFRKAEDDNIKGLDSEFEWYHRIGVHTGRVVAGNIGGQSFMKYGVMGDVVNVAARLEELNKEHGTSVLISSEVYETLPGDLQASAVYRGQIRLRGREQLQQVYSL